MIKNDEVKTKLKKYIISRETHPEIPSTLDGEILVREFRRPDGRLLGVSTVSIDGFLNLPDEINVGKKRRDRPEFTFEEMIDCDPQNKQGWNEVLRKWHREGLI